YFNFGRRNTIFLEEAVGVKLRSSAKRGCQLTLLALEIGCRIRATLIFASNHSDLRNRLLDDLREYQKIAALQRSQRDRDLACNRKVERAPKKRLKRELTRSELLQIYIDPFLLKEVLVLGYHHQRHSGRCLDTYRHPVLPASAGARGHQRKTANQNACRLR